jgi:hypothetical protein
MLINDLRELVMSTQSEATNKGKKFNTFQILFVEWLMYFGILLLLQGEGHTTEEVASAAVMLLFIIRFFLFLKKSKS